MQPNRQCMDILLHSLYTHIERESATLWVATHPLHTPLPPAPPSCYDCNFSYRTLFSILTVGDGGGRSCTVPKVIY